MTLDRQAETHIWHSTDRQAETDNALDIRTDSDRSGVHKMDV